MSAVFQTFSVRALRRAAVHVRCRFCGLLWLDRGLDDRQLANGAVEPYPSYAEERPADRACGCNRHLRQCFGQTLRDIANARHRSKREDRPRRRAGGRARRDQLVGLRRAIRRLNPGHRGDPLEGRFRRAIVIVWSQAPKFSTRKFGGLFGECQTGSVSNNSLTCCSYCK